MLSKFIPNAALAGGIIALGCAAIFSLSSAKSEIHGLGSGKPSRLHHSVEALPSCRFDGSRCPVSGGKCRCGVLRCHCDE
jgi:hypothetical protein